MEKKRSDAVMAGLAGDYGETFVEFLRVFDVNDHDPARTLPELLQLHRQGVGRNFGLIVTAQRLGVIQKKVASDASSLRDSAAPTSPAVYRLGNCLTENVEVLDPSADKCEAFLRAARDEEKSMSDAACLDAADRTSDLIDYGTRRAKTFSTKPLPQTLPAFSQPVVWGSAT